MNLISFLEKKKIVSQETLQIFAYIIFTYVLSYFYWKTRFICLSYGFLLITLGGACNLYVIDFNDFKMPVLANRKSDFRKIKKQNPKRQICLLDSKTKLGWLADRFFITIIGRTLSMGDFLIFFGFGLIILSLLLKLIKI